MIIVDRFEGNFAVIEDSKKIYMIKRVSINKAVKEGDVLIKLDGVYYVDEEATARRREEILNKLKRCRKL